MKIQTHQQAETKIAEVIAEGMIINNAEEGTQLLVDLYYQDFDKVMLYEKNITPAFFDLSTKLAGDILQHVSNFRMRVVIIGEFDQYPGKSIRDFIFESNKGKQVNFLTTVEEAKKKLFS